MLLRILCCGLLVAALGTAPAAAQAPTTTSTSQTATTQDEIVLQGDTTPRPALPTFYGDTGLWFVSTAETLPAGKFSASVFRANFDRRQGLTDVNHIGVTGAFGVTSFMEVFGSWRTVRLDRDVRPTFIPGNPEFGGVSQEYPYMNRGWSDTMSGPFYAGLKFSLLAQGRGDAMNLAPRVMMKFPTGDDLASTNDWDGHFDLIASRELGGSIELTGQAGGVLRGDPDEFRVSDGVNWGVGATFPTRSPFRGLVEYHGEFVIKDDALVLNPPFIAEDGSVAPLLSPISDPTQFKIGAVWQHGSGFFVHGGLNYSWGTDGQVVSGVDVEHNAWGADVRLGWHPGVTPRRQRVRVIKETTTVTNTVTPPPPPAPPAPNRNPTFGVTATCDPLIVAPNQTSNCRAQATDPDGDPVTYRWTAPQGAFKPADAANTVWTAPGQTGTVAITVTASDNRGGSATATVAVQVVRRQEIVFEDVHFDFDRFNLRPDALKILEDAVAKLQANPDIRVTIEGHCDSIGTSEYNLALGERRATSVRNFLTGRGVGDARLRTVSYGEDRPVADNNTTQGRAQNRRAHLVVVLEQ